jgi:hypothetical protein
VGIICRELPAKPEQFTDDVIGFWRVQPWTGLAPNLQATTRRGSSFRVELLLLVSGPNFWCKAPWTLYCIERHNCRSYCSHARKKERK